MTPQTKLIRLTIDPPHPTSASYQCLFVNPIISRHCFNAIFRMPYDLNRHEYGVQMVCTQAISGSLTPRVLHNVDSNTVTNSGGLTSQFKVLHGGMQVLAEDHGGCKKSDGGGNRTGNMSVLESHASFVPQLVLTMYRHTTWPPLTTSSTRPQAIPSIQVTGHT